MAGLILFAMADAIAQADFPARARWVRFAARTGLVKPRQPLSAFNPFDSIFLIFRRVVSAPGSSPPRLQGSSEGTTLATYLASALSTFGETAWVAI